MKDSSKQSILIAWGIILFFLAAWEVCVHVFKVQQYILPAPSLILKTLFLHPAEFLHATILTVSEAFAGLFLGVAAGFLIASLLILYPGMEGGVMTLAILVKSTPLVAIAPLLTLWLGFGIVPKIVITALMTFFPVLVNILSGLTQTDPALVDLFRSWHASKREIFVFLRLPYSLPYLFAALKISAPLALVGAVVAEWTGASGGLGRTMWLAYNNLNLPFMFAAIFILALIGITLYQFLVRLEKRFVFWNQLRISE